MKLDGRTVAGALADERVCYVPEPLGLEPIWHRYTEGQTRSAKVWSDAYLAAFACASGIAVVSSDEGFRKFSDLEPTVPE